MRERLMEFSVLLRMVLLRLTPDWAMLARARCLRVQVRVSGGSSCSIRLAGNNCIAAEVAAAAAEVAQAPSFISSCSFVLEIEPIIYYTVRCKISNL